MLTWSFNERGNQPLYEYLYCCIREDIRSGRLRAGEKLPSKRALAQHNGISVMTVENAYAQLLSEGYILSRPRQGFFVAELPSVKAPKVRTATPVPQPASVPAHWLADFTSNQTCRDSFPFTTWSATVRRVLSEQQERLLTNPPWGGIPELREAIAEHLAAFRGLSVRPEQILIGAGTEYLYGLLLQLIGLDKIYGFEVPGYGKIGRIYASHGVRCEAIPMDVSGVMISALEEQHVDVVHISPAHHFPTGLVVPATRRYELLRWAEQGRYIIEDDYDSEFRMAGRPIPTLQSIDRDERVIYMNTFSKTLASTVRIAYMVLPEHLLRRYQQTMSFYSCTVSNFEQYTLAAFIRQGSFERHLNRMRTDYHRRRDLLLRLLREHPLAERVSVSGEDGGLHFLLHVKTDLPDELMEKKAAEKGVRLNALSRYDGDKKTLHSFVINYSSVPAEVMP